MPTALELGRTALLEAMKREIDKINVRVVADSNRQDDEWRKRCDTLKADAEERQRSLETEISTLRESVGTLTAALAQAEAHQTAAVPDTAQAADMAKEDNAAITSRQMGDVLPSDREAERARFEHEIPSSIDDSDPSAAIVAELSHSLDKARARYEDAKEKLSLTLSVAKKRKEAMLSWMKYAESLERKVKQLENKLAGGKAASRVATPDAPLTPVTAEKSLVEVQKPSASASFSSGSSSFSGSFEPDRDDNQEVPPMPRGDVGTPATTEQENNNNSGRTVNDGLVESTQGEPSSDVAEPELPTPRASSTGENDHDHRHVIVKHEPSSDGPEFVWERPVKKQKIDSHDGAERAQLQTLQIQTCIKRENSDRVSLAVAASYRESQESIDLDEGQLVIPTPRKRQHVYHLEPLSEIPSEDLCENGSQENSGEAPGRSEGSAPAAATPATPLAPLSVNIRRESRGGVGPLTRKDPVQSLKQLKRGVESLAEDNEGNQNRPPSMSGCPNQPRSTMSPSVLPEKPSRLSALLNSRPSEPSPVSSLPRTISARKHVGSPVSNAFGQPPPVRTLPQLRGETSPAAWKTPKAGGLFLTPKAGDRSREANRATTTQTTATLTSTTPLAAALMAARAENSTAASAKKAAAAAAAATPLRGRPVNQLRLGDFRINPARNDGEGFAYSEVVRGRSDREELDGCTDPQCCGKAFRAMAESELTTNASAHVNRPDSVVLMERFLGNNAFVLARMSPDEKRELWIEARTKELADKYGKHRHRYHRRASPPGFWDADFPTTQEEQQNRAESEKIEKAAIQERYREATRPGGRWLFRDE